MCKEIVIQNFRYFDKKRGINGRGFENAINIRAVARQLLSKPRGSPPLLVHYALYNFSYMNFFGHKKSVKLFRNCLLNAVASPNASSTNKHETVHAHSSVNLRNLFS